jgi:predicted naringenin-chalcone synthase
MSSATILFVLKHLLEQPSQNKIESVLAMAFGPGLTIESGLFNKISG